MTLRLKHLSEQVMVITGATSGIGLATARMAAQRGARLVLAAPGGSALEHLAGELRREGTQVASLAADAANQAGVARIGMAATERFGHIDTWINIAGISILGRNEDVALEDRQRLFQTSFWGVVHGSLEAVRHMKTRGGGALINLGSELAEYPASMHAVAGFTDSLRMQLEQEKAPMSVTLVKPASIDTLSCVHSRNDMEREPALPPPIYAPELVAEAILYAAQHPRRDILVGVAAKPMSPGAFHMPRLLARLVRAALYEQQQPGAAGRRDAARRPAA